jgi:hypothetical protein
MKNHGACITYALQPLSVVLYTTRSVLIAWMCYGKYLVFSKTSSRHEFSVPSHVSTSLLLHYKFWMVCMQHVHQSTLYIVFGFLLQAQVDQDYCLRIVPNPPCTRKIRFVPWKPPKT